MRLRKWAAVLLVAAALLTLVAASRSFEYDEAYSVFVTSGTPRPDWPHGVFRVGDVRAAFHRHAGPVAIAAALRRTDVHPPLYFWALGLWREWFGDSLLAMRSLSVLCAVLSVGLVGAIALEAEVPPLGAMALTLGSYGFAYTGSVARGFAMAVLLVLLGALLALRAARRSGRLTGAAAGLALGAATLTNYLSAFAAAAILLWFGAAARRRPRPALAGLLAYAACIPAVLFFFVAQRDSRAGQFPPFQLAHAASRIACYAAANLVGGLPLYLSEAPRTAAVGALAALLCGLVLAVVRRWRHIATPGARWLFLGVALAQPAGLLALGFAFDSIPVELRYLCFAVPFVALLLAGALDRPPVGRGLAVALGGVQAASIAGLAFHPATMQPFARVARAAAAQERADGVIIAPFGNDGVGAVGPLLASLPDAARVVLVRPGTAAATLAALAPARPVVARLPVDRASRAVLAEMRDAQP